MVIRNLQVKSLICLIVLDTCIINAQETYFQQEVNYRIDVTLDDSRNQLHAFEEIEYINNSPDTLAILYFHLW
ncbi:MAG: hypothetical protein ACM3NR_00490, partial [Methanosarcina sp.]